MTTSHNDRYVSLERDPRENPRPGDRVADRSSSGLVQQVYRDARGRTVVVYRLSAAGVSQGVVTGIRGWRSRWPARPTDRLRSALTTRPEPGQGSQG